MQFSGRRNERTFAKQVAYFLDESLVLTGCDSGRIAVWDRRTGELLRRFKADGNIVNCVAAHPYAPLLASSGIDSNIKLWTLGSTRRTLEAMLGQDLAPRQPPAPEPGAPSEDERHRFGAERVGPAGASSGSEEEDEDEDEAEEDQEMMPPQMFVALLRMIQRQGGVDLADILRAGRGGNGDDDGDNDNEEDDDDDDDA